MMENKKQIVLDTETTGLVPGRIIEVACIELISRKRTHNNFHSYFNPERSIEKNAFLVHGISKDFLADKPRFLEIIENFITYIDGAELIIHNAPFDIRFLNAEFRIASQISGKKFGVIKDYCTILDTLKLAQTKYPGQRNNLDALCKRHYVTASQRGKHSAQEDTDLLTTVYLRMTGGQISLFGDLEATRTSTSNQSGIPPLTIDKNLSITPAIPSQQECSAHQAFLKKLAQSSQQDCLWSTLDASNTPPKTTVLNDDSNARDDDKK